ncbi:MAG: hypothetical protein GC150_10320 [Rhizobiales bacterium]|nr:hypothetical protein [Hyphomicrobiales bacterium]
MTARVQRRLAAVLAVDMVDYSSHIEDDEFGTITRFKEVVNTIFVPNLREFNGRIVKTMGDGLLIEFQSAVDAVECAIEVQTEIARRNAKLPARERCEFRMGINLGDIVIDGDDILGDGVNVASRLETLAPPGGLVISDIVYRNVHGKIEVRFTDLGTQNLKNIAKAIQAFVAVLDETTPTRATNAIAGAAREDSLAARLDEAQADLEADASRRPPDEDDGPYEDEPMDGRHTGTTDQRAAPPPPRGRHAQPSRFGSGLATGSAIGLAGIAAVSLLAWWFWPSMMDDGDRGGRGAGAIVAERGTAPGREATTPAGATGNRASESPSGTPASEASGATPAAPGGAQGAGRTTNAGAPGANDLGAVPGLPPGLAGSTTQGTTGGASGSNTGRATVQAPATVPPAPTTSAPSIAAPADNRPQNGTVADGDESQSGSTGTQGGDAQPAVDGGARTVASADEPRGGATGTTGGETDSASGSTGEGTSDTANTQDATAATDANGTQTDAANQQAEARVSTASCRRQHAGNIVRLGGGADDDGRTPNNAACAEGPVYIADTAGGWRSVEMDGQPLVARDVHSTVSARGPLLVALDTQNHLVLVYSRSPSRIVTSGGSRNAIVAQDRDGRPMKVASIRRLAAGGNISWGGTLQLEVRTTDGRNCSIAAGPDGLFTWRGWSC